MSTSDEEKTVAPLEKLSSAVAFETAAERCLSPYAWEYISGGEADTIARNQAAFADFGFRPRVLKDVASVSLGCELFGTRYDTPFYLSSVAKGKLVNSEGEALFARAAVRANAAYVVPHVASVPFEKIWAASSPRERLPYQLYMLEDEEGSFEQFREVLARGVSAVLVTVDNNAPRSEAFQRATGRSIGVFPSPSLTWERLAEIRAMVPDDVPIYLKGVQTGEDALKAVRLGVRGLIVSNHGGRACGNSWASLHALEDVTSALAGAGVAISRSLPQSTGGQSVQLLFDSGVRSGRDALKALCLGASGVGIGRPYYWAAACHGEEGIAALLRMLAAELRFAMAQVGAASIDQLRRSLLCRLTPAPRPLADFAILPASARL